jgi:glycosyltransferase involved in cell wall biosynthesis
MLLPARHPSSSSDDSDSGISVVIPAHNEEAVLGRCLESLLAQEFEGALQVVVTANGCQDATYAVAQSYDHAMRARGFELEVAELTAASKARALNVGDALAKHASRIYLDADVELSPHAVSSIADAFDRGGIQFCAPRLVPVAATYAARVYGRVWSQIPYVKGEVIGAGVYAVRADGRGRWTDFPEIIADDKFARLHFEPHERRVLAGSSFLMYLPVGLGELIRVRSRWIRANRELRRRFPRHAAGDKRRLAGIVGFACRRGSLWLDMPVFVVIYACAELLALLPRRGRWERASKARELRRPASSTNA